MKAYSEEFRRDVLAARDAGESTHDVALRFKVSKAWVRRIVQQRRETGQVAPKKKRKRVPKWQAWADWIRAKVKARPDIYLHELQADLKSELGESASIGLLCIACGELKCTRKKRRSSLPSKIARTLPVDAKSGAPRSQAPKQTASSSLMKRGRKPT